ncbi:hypothetical protein [Chlorobium sp. N1]|uniref:hypothetical protein n=1 Tax=Chlorobium sp. N1 TaxID=2491138 RepID=UPI0010389B62|nr:hypothetical protein [Chlorobium sp. N1]TCD47326.1 hypothetical protein E0L29_08525 [Chlorobium sp. N1]
MPERKGEDILAGIGALEGGITALVNRLDACRKENAALKSELASLQEVLRSMKLPGGGSTPAPKGGGAGPVGELAYAEKLQVKQKLVLILQKIEMELRGGQAV